MNLREVVRSGYKIFSRMNPEKQKAHILAVQYIELLSNQTNTKMEPWDLLSVFGTGKGNELVTDKKEINKLFFAKLEDIKTKTPAQVFALEERVTVEIDRLSRGLTDREITRLRTARDKDIHSANEAMSRAATFLTSAANLHSQLSALERRESTVPGQISQIVQENFWDFHQLTGANLELVTKNDIILTQKNPAAGVDLRVNLGRVKAILNLQSMSLSVLQHERNLNVRGYYHPHVNTGGGICWGTGAGVVTQKLPKGEVAEVLRLLSSVLTNYNDGNPYVHLADFQEIAKNDAPPKDAPAPLPPGFATVEPRPAAESRSLPGNISLGGSFIGWVPPQLGGADATLAAALRAGAEISSAAIAEPPFGIETPSGASAIQARQSERSALLSAMQGGPPINIDDIVLTVSVDASGQPQVQRQEREGRF